MVAEMERTDTVNAETVDVETKAKAAGGGRGGRAAKSDGGPITIEPPNFLVVTVKIVGTSPYVQHAFPAKARAEMRAKQEAGSTARKGKVRQARDFEDDYHQAMHRSTEGWIGIPASSIRNACIESCRMVGYQMTRARMSVFVLHHGIDEGSGEPLVKIEGTPEPVEHAVRNETGVADIRVRPMWRQWGATFTLQYDGDQFTREDVVNLVQRAGMQCGIGEGRPFSKRSNGMGWGCFRLDGVSEAEPV